MCLCLSCMQLSVPVIGVHRQRSHLLGANGLSISEEGTNSSFSMVCAASWFFDDTRSIYSISCWCRSLFFATLSDCLVSLFSVFFSFMMYDDAHWEQRSDQRYWMIHVDEFHRVFRYEVTVDFGSVFIFSYAITCIMIPSFLSRSFATCSVSDWWERTDCFSLFDVYGWELSLHSFDFLFLVMIMCVI